MQLQSARMAAQPLKPPMSKAERFRSYQFESFSCIHMIRRRRMDIWILACEAERSFPAWSMISTHEIS